MRGRGPSGRGQARVTLFLALHLSLAAGRGGSWGPVNRAHLSIDMTFIHEGNHTLVENLINFEKMVSARRLGV